MAVFARGHVLLEGNVGVGKTTLLRAIAHALGGEYQRIEGTIDLMPADLVYYTYLDSKGKPQVDAGPLLKNGENLATFFFNEINRARPQVHSMLLRVMAERQVSAFNQEFQFPHLQVFADRNRIEKEETFELPAAARDRFMMEINIDMPDNDGLLQDLAFDTRFHDVDRLIGSLEASNISYYQLNELAEIIQREIKPTTALKKYVLELWKATHNPKQYGIDLDDVEMDQLMLSGASPRGVSYLIRAAKVNAWLECRTTILPEDLQAVFPVIMKHRIFLSPVYGYRKEQLLPELIDVILDGIAAP